MGLLLSLALCTLMVVLSLPSIRYEMAHDIPNPWWGIFSYVPEQGPPSPVLLDTRPETVVEQYIADYVRVAGTYPCVASLTAVSDPGDFASYEINTDPILRPTGTCTVHRPVASMRMTAVFVGVLGVDTGVNGAIVNFSLTYATGEHWSNRLILRPYRMTRYYLAFIHQDCWDISGAIWLYYRFYPQPITRRPKGLAYYANGSPVCLAAEPHG